MLKDTVKRKRAATKHKVVEPEARSEVEENDKREASPELHRVLKKESKKIEGQAKATEVVRHKTCSSHCFENA